MRQHRNESLKPLSGIRVLDLGMGMCAALAGKLLADAGAEILRLEPPAGDPFYAAYPAYRFWQLGKTSSPAPKPSSAPRWTRPICA